MSDGKEKSQLAEIAPVLGGVAAVLTAIGTVLTALHAFRSDPPKPVEPHTTASSPAPSVSSTAQQTPSSQKLPAPVSTSSSTSKHPSQEFEPLPAFDGNWTTRLSLSQVLHVTTIRTAEGYKSQITTEHCAYDKHLARVEDPISLKAVHEVNERTVQLTYSDEATLELTSNPASPTILNGKYHVKADSFIYPQIFYSGKHGCDDLDRYNKLH